MLIRASRLRRGSGRTRDRCTSGRAGSYSFSAAARNPNGFARRGERLRRVQRIDPLDEGLEVAREVDQEGDRRVDDVPGRRRSVQQVLRELELARHR